MKNKKLPPLAVIQDNFSYDADTGVVSWRKDHGKMKCGAIAGSEDERGYRQIRLHGRMLYAHRIAYFLHTGVDPSFLNIDHKNGNRSDNKFSNLRVGTQSENLCNAKGHRDSGSGIKGVSWCKSSGKWLAQIQFKKKKEYIGRFSNMADASSAVAKRRDELHQKFARHE